MPILHPHCAAWDVHKKSVTVAVRTHVNGRPYTIETAEFRTYTSDLERLAEWLKERRVKPVAIAYASHCTQAGLHYVQFGFAHRPF